MSFVVIKKRLFPEHVSMMCATGSACADWSGRALAKPVAHFFKRLLRLNTVFAKRPLAETAGSGSVESLAITPGTLRKV